MSYYKPYAAKRSRYSGARRSTNKSRKQYIHPEKFIKPAKQIRQEEYLSVNSFDDFQLNSLIKQNVKNKGYLTPSPIQDQAIPHAIDGKDVIGIANTGTGKTAAFSLPILDKLINDGNSRAIILAPTRELAQQIEEEIRSYAKNSGLCGAVLIGGTPMGKQLRELSAGLNIVIGTPGRIKDHIKRGTLNLSKFNIVVLDEVDRMVDMGFINDIREILQEIATVRQSLFFSATIDQKINSLIKSFMKDPVTISVKQGDTSDNVEQNIVKYNSNGEKIDKLHNLLIDSGVKKALVFDETQRSVERLSKELLGRGFKVSAIHGGKTQGHRQRALNQFRDNNISVLVATDVAARGIDVSDITHVINYSTPASYDDYIHRIGRAGRAGKAGNALTFISN